MKNIKNFFLATLGLLIIYSCAVREANYKYLGKYKYKITNDSLFNNTYLTDDSFGYVIGNLSIPGVKIENIESLNSNEDYIISRNHPIKNALRNSELIENEGINHTTKKPLDVILDKTVTTDEVYIYLLKPKGAYRLILP